MRPRNTSTALLLVALLAAVGCQTAPGTAPSGGAASPTEFGYKTQRYLDAIAGLRFDSGLVEVEAFATHDAALSAQRLSEGRELLETGYHVEALKAYGDAIRAAPENAAAYDALGFVLQLKGKTDESIAAFRTAIRIDDGLADAHFNLAIAHWRLGESAAAIERMERVIAIDPGHARAHGQLARWHYFAHDLEQARQHALKAQTLGEPLPAPLQRLIADS